MFFRKCKACNDTKKEDSAENKIEKFLDWLEKEHQEIMNLNNTEEEDERRLKND